MLRKLFEEFNHSTELKYRVGFDKHLERIELWISEFDLVQVDDYAEIENKILSITSNKINLISTSNEFIKYIKTKGYSYSSSLGKAYVSFQRRVEIAKFLHEPRSRDDIMENFFISERQLRSDLGALKDGVDFFGTTLKISVVKTEGNLRTTTNDENYILTAHPIVLMLNLTEVYELTIGLLNVVKGNPSIYNEYSKLANKIYTQLSDYGREVIKTSNQDKHNLFQSESISYRSEAEMFEENWVSRFMYMLKTRSKGEIIYNKDGKIIIEKCTAVDYDKVNYKFVNSNNEELIIHTDDVISFGKIEDYI